MSFSASAKSLIPKTLPAAANMAKYNPHRFIFKINIPNARLNIPLINSEMASVMFSPNRDNPPKKCIPLSKIKIIPKTIAIVLRLPEPESFASAFSAFGIADKFPAAANWTGWELPDNKFLPQDWNC